MLPVIVCANTTHSCDAGVLLCGLVLQMFKAPGSSELRPARQLHLPASTLPFPSTYDIPRPTNRNANTMNSVASKRLFQEYKHLTQDPPDGITAGPVNEDDLFLWEALIQGPEGTPYEGGIFPAEIKFPKDYPLMPPVMKFTCEIWHPNGEDTVPECGGLGILAPLAQQADAIHD